MDIGIIGLGVVGEAIAYGFSSAGHNIKAHDIKMDTSIKDVLDTDIVYLCVPSKSLDAGECDTSIVESVIKELVDASYNGIICIKSTVTPGTTQRISEKYNIKRQLCMVPEFLRERCAIHDFMDNHDICIIGMDHTNTIETEAKISRTVRKSHGDYPKEFIEMSFTEAELCKYFNNIYNATLITFANSFYEVVKSFGVNYDIVKNACVKRNHINDVYLNCNENLRGFGGVCLPKDLKAIVHYVKQSDIDVDFFNNILLENDKYKTTVFAGMRLKGVNSE